MIDRACISLNSICNLDCPYCHFGSKKNNNESKLSQFTIDEVEVVMNNLFTYISVQRIDKFKLGIVGSGEPMLSFEVIKKIVEYVNDSRYSKIVKLYMITNGTIMTEDHIDFFYKHKHIIDVNFSLDGFEMLHNQYRSAFDVTMRNISLYEEKFGHKPTVNTVVTRNSFDKQDELFEFFYDQHFSNVNFSQVFGVNNSTINISQQEYSNFLNLATNHGITSRQSAQTTKKYDCTKYGRLCGVGRNNIFITRLGVYPCARFMGNLHYKLGEYNDQIDDIESELHKIKPVEDGQCFYEYNKVGK